MCDESFHKNWDKYTDKICNSCFLHVVLPLKLVTIRQLLAKIKDILVGERMTGAIVRGGGQNNKNC